jgi:hypothetical protein
MTEVIAQTKTGRLTTQGGWLYLFMLLAAAFGILLCLVTLKVLTEHKFTSANSGFEAALAQPQLDLLLIGSSHTRKSYDMRLLEKTTGDHSIFLVNYDGTDLTAISQMLDYMASNPGTCPRHVVVEAYGVLLGRKPDLQDPRYFAEAPPSLKIEILRTYMAGRPFGSAFLDLFDLVVNRGNEEILAFPLYAWAQNVDSYKGGRIGSSFGGMTPEEFRQLKVDFYTASPNPDQVKALHHIMDLSARNHIALVFIDTPMPGPVSSDPTVRSLRKDFEDIVTTGGFPYMDGNQNFPVDAPSLFSDNNHLSSLGQEEFTARIAIPLKRWLAGGAMNTGQN